MRRMICGTTALIVVLTASQARAGLLVEATAGTQVGTFAVGQSVTTPVGGPFDEIMFNWFDSAGTPTAAGTLFLLSQEYLGLAADLSAATPGFVAMSQGISGGVYLFDPGVTLLGGTQYFFLTDTEITVSGGTETYAGGNLYSPDGDIVTDPFVSSPRLDANFRLSGSLAEAAVPEPGSLALLAVGGIGIAGGWYRRRRKAAA